MLVALGVMLLLFLKILFMDFKSKKTEVLFSLAIASAMGLMFCFGSTLGYAIPKAMQSFFMTMGIVFSIATKINYDKDKKKDDC